MIRRSLFATAPLVLFPILFLFMISCSSTRQATDTDGSDSRYPAWYNATSEFSRSADSYSAFGMAVGADSAAAVRRAVAKAQSNLEQHISSTLEAARSDAISPESNGNLGSPAFIFRLREAEATISEAASVTQTGAVRNDTYGSFQGFAEVTISKEALVTKLNPLFGADREAWHGLKVSAGLDGSE